MGDSILIITGGIHCAIVSSSRGLRSENRLRSEHSSVSISIENSSAHPFHSSTDTSLQLGSLCGG